MGTISKLSNVTFGDIAKVDGIVTANIAKISGETATPPFINDYCLEFDGVNDYVDCGNDVSLQITGDVS